MHNGYFYPQDVKITVKNGIRTAEAVNVAKKCYLSGWEMARRVYEDKKIDKMMIERYPVIYFEKIAAKKAHAIGMSVTQFRRFW